MESESNPEVESNKNNNEQDNKESEIQFSKIYDKENENQKQITESIYQNDMFSTKAFIKSIDLRCEDHLSKFQEDVEATRFCQKCNILVCDSCVIDYHIDHINEAKKKVDEYFISQKNSIIDLRNKIKDSSKFKVNEKEIDKIVNSQKKIVEDFFSRRAEQSEIFVKKIKNIQNQEKEIKEAIIKSIEIFYRDECFKRLKSPIENNELLAKKIERFFKDWTQYNKREKIVALKNNIIEDFKKETENNIYNIQEEMKNFKGKSLDIEKKINGLIDTLNKNDKIDEFNKIFSEINDNNLNIIQDINELKYDKLVVQKLEDIKNKKVDIDYNYKNLLQDKLYNDNNNNNNINNNIDKKVQSNIIDSFNYNQPQNIPYKLDEKKVPPQQSQNIPYPIQEQKAPPQHPQNMPYPIPEQKVPPQQLSNNLPSYEQNFVNNLDDSKNGFNLFNNMDSGNIQNNNSNNNPPPDFLNNSNYMNMNSNINKNNNYNNINQSNIIDNSNDNNFNNPYEVKNNQNINPSQNYYNHNVNQGINMNNFNAFTYDLIIYLLDDTILAYNEKNGLFKLKLEAENLRRIPQKSRFVNLGQSALLTGGINPDTNKASVKCYLIGLLEEDSSNKPKYCVNVSPYGDLKEARERHNLLYVPNKNFVFACGGFYSQSCEYTDVFKGNWDKILPLNKSRGNASMAYVNERFIYILGGFELRPGAQEGYYLNDLEIFDLNNFGNGWKLINFNNPHGYNMSLTALGVVPLTPNAFLVCGGFDGGKGYKNNVYKIDCTNPFSPLVEEKNQILNNPTIFTHNMFCKIRKSLFNFNFQGQMYGFDYEQGSFGVLQNNPIEM